MKCKPPWKIGVMLCLTLLFVCAGYYLVSLKPIPFIEIPSENADCHMGFSPEGRYLFDEKQMGFAFIPKTRRAVYNYTVFVCDVAERKVILTLNDAHLSCFTDENHLAVYSDALKQTQVYSLPNGLITVFSPNNYYPLGVLPDGNLLLGKEKRAIYRWDYKKNTAPQFLFSLPPLKSSNERRDVKLLEDGKTLYVRNWAPKAPYNSPQYLNFQLWSVSLRKRQYETTNLSTFGGGGSNVSSGSNGLCIWDQQIWNSQTRKMNLNLQPVRNRKAGNGWPQSFSQSFYGLSVSPNGSFITGINNFYTRIKGHPAELHFAFWNSQNGQFIQQYSDHIANEILSGFCVSRDGKILALSKIQLEQQNLTLIEFHPMPKLGP